MNEYMKLIETNSRHKHNEQTINWIKAGTRDIDGISWHDL